MSEELNTQKVPANAYLADSSYGSGWEHDRGYRAAGETCLALKLPDNAHIDYSGNDWDCKRHYRKQQGRHKTMIGVPVDLDTHRGMASQEATDMRRVRLKMFQADQTALRHRQEELEQLLHAAPAKTWPEAAAKARYLIKLFASTPEAQDPRRKELITRALDDLARLCDRAKE